MSRELICAWLKIRPEPWPPDHYTLVGLPPGESDPARIEKHVHERHEALQRYQLAHPEVVTEALNCLANAFVCLTDPEAKKAYDTALLGELLPAAKAAVAPPPKATVPPPAPLPPTAPESPSSVPAASPPAPVSAGKDPLAWLYGPWTQAGRDTLATVPADATPVEGSPAPTPASVQSAPITTSSPTAPPPPEPTDPVLEAARSPIARRGLSTKRALYYRISRTRQLLRAWVLVGNFVGNATAPLTKRADAVDMVRQLTNIRQLLQGFPPLLGQAGQPGYLVVALSRQQMILQTFLALLPSQREALVRDWQAGLTLLAAHRLFLREELRVLRRRSRIGRTLRALAAMVADHPIIWLFLTGLAALNLVYAPLLELWPFQLAGLAALLLILGIRRLFSPRQSWLRRKGRARR
ncbi:MAG: hypothetical protein K2R98_31930 [Gemmataceae bacterium]|nr:hypothetical protein [Gemmataceae bacterium]